MSRMSIQAAVTMGQLQNKLDLIGNNMANVNTSGYKNRNADFSSLLFQQIDNLSDPSNQQGRLTPDGIRVGNGAALGHTNSDLSQGAINDTGRDLDVAILNPNQLFQINVTENEVTETQYTRSGTFYLSPLENGNVMLTTQDGHPVIGENGPILIEEGFDSISITSDGSIETSRNGIVQTEDQLTLMEAVRPRLLEATGNNNFRLPEVAETDYNPDEIIQNVAEADVQLKSGALENSNVDIAKQMTELLATQRAYQLNARSISMDDQMSGLINQLR